MAAEGATATGATARPLPLVTALTEPFWTAGSEGLLRVYHCKDCGLWVHPPEARCPRCLSTHVNPEPVSGRAELLSFTVNYQPWQPSLKVPYTIGIVELLDATGVRLTTNVVNCPIEDVRIGMELRVVFEQVEEVFLPLFEPVDS
jgi:uncharacterized protein